MDAVAQANDLHKTQFSNGHREQPKKKTWKWDLNWKPIHEMDKRAQLSANGLKDDTIQLREFRGKSLLTRTQMRSLKVPRTANWSNGFCSGSAAPFKTMWTRYVSCGKFEVSDSNSDPVRNSDDKTLEFCGERSWATFYQQLKAKLHSIPVTERKHGNSYGIRRACNQNVV